MDFSISLYIPTNMKFSLFVALKGVTGHICEGGGQIRHLHQIPYVTFYKYKHLLTIRKDHACIDEI